MEKRTSWSEFSRKVFANLFCGECVGLGAAAASFGGEALGKGIADEESLLAPVDGFWISGSNVLLPTGYNANQSDTINTSAFPNTTLK